MSTWDWHDAGGRSAPSRANRLKGHRSCDTATKPARTVDEYISAAPEEVQGKLREVRAAIRDVAPDAAESISYRMAYYSYKGRLAWFGLHSGHIGIYIRPPVIAEHKKELAGYETTKSALRIPLDEDIPVALIKKLVRARMKKNEAERR